MAEVTLDILVVGGGPAGTATAFQATELGLSVLVIDYDDLMKRIRDYAADKLILPDFGGGDRMQFPDGGELIRSLHFSAIDKDDMCSHWKELYRKHDVPFRTGLELIGLAAEADGIWGAELWNHDANEAETLMARHVVLAFGRGVPRRLDIPGPVDGLAFRMSDAGEYTGAPCCVIGGGTSAAEAVIAISEAKASAGDLAPVWWSYRGDKMPKVSKALADAFFNAYVGNGNVRYLPRSEPVGVTTSREGREFLCLRTDRKELDDRPVETTQLEFHKSHCLACIGEDIPTGLLSDIGIEMVTGGPKNRPRLVVSPLLETVRPNVYLVGDILSPAYLEAHDFDAVPEEATEIKRRGNIKAALRDGVLVARAIAQKLEGKQDVHVHLEFADAPADAGAVAEAPAELTSEALAPKTRDGTADAGTPTSNEPQPRLVRLLGGGVEAEEYPLGDSESMTIGGAGADIAIDGDSLLSGIHATISRQGDDYYVESIGEASAAFLRVGEKRAVELPPGAVVRAGRQWLVFGDENDRRSFTHYDQRGRLIGRHELPGETTIVGRQSPNITLSDSDLSLSRRHLVLSIKSAVPTVRDLKSGNGTFLKIDRPTKLEDGDEFGLGRQVLRLTLSEPPEPVADISFDTGITRLDIPIPTPDSSRRAGSPADRPAGSAAHGSAKEEPAGAGGTMVTFQGTGKSFPAREGQTICALAEEQGITINAECHSGICGSDPIRIISGEENLHPMGDDEEAALEELCDLSPEGHRLACMARPTGPVVVEIIEP